MFPAPPSSTTTSPSATRPAASAPATWSAPPATTGTPRRRGSSAQATVPRTVAGGATGPSQPGSTWAAWQMSAAHSPARKSYRPLSSAQFASTGAAPAVSRRTTKS